MKVDKKTVMAAFSLAQLAYDTRGLNEYEKKLARDMFYALPHDDLETQSYIANVFSEVFNKVMS